jgi:translation initiation factor 1 (eIF-1/SUI1)
MEQQSSAQALAVREPSIEKGQDRRSRVAREVTPISFQMRGRSRKHVTIVESWDTTDETAQSCEERLQGGLDVFHR